MQEPIISEELFDRVEEIRQNPQQFKIFFIEQNTAQPLFRDCTVSCIKTSLSARHKSLTGFLHFLMISTTDSRRMVAHAKLLFHGDLPLLSSSGSAAERGCGRHGR